jgi:hypothetical protein
VEVPIRKTINKGHATPYSKILLVTLGSPNKNWIGLMIRVVLSTYTNNLIANDHPMNPSI